MPFWERAVIAGAVFAMAAIAAMVVDRRLARRQLTPETATRYRVLRRTLMSSIVAVGLLSALLVIPQVRAVAGGLLASSAFIGLIVGFASQRTLGNFVAGLLIAFSQPLRLGDRVMVDEEIGLSYTFIRALDGARLVIPNEKLASDTILNFTIRSPEKVAEVTVQVPLGQDLDALVEQLAAETQAEVYVSSLEGNATLTLRSPARSEDDALRLEHELRLSAYRRLRRRRRLCERVQSHLAAAGVDRLEHVHLRGRRDAARRDPGGTQSHAGPLGPDQQLDAEGDGGDRGQAFLAARRCGSGGDRARDRRGRQGRPRRAGRVDDHATARAQPLHLAREDGEAQAEGSLSRREAFPEALQAVDPHAVHERGVLRRAGVWSGGRRTDVLFQACESPDAVGDRTAGGSAASAVGLRPVSQSGACARTAQRGAARDAGDGDDHARSVLRRGRRSRSGLEAGPAVQGDPAAVLLLLCPRRVGARLRSGAYSLRRPPGLYDDRSGAAGRCAQGDQGHAVLLVRPGGCGCLDQPGQRRDPGDGGGVSGAQQKSVQLDRAGASPGRLDVQGVRAHRGDRAGDESGDDDVPVGAAALPTRPDL